MTIRTLEETTETGYELRDEALERSLFVDVMTDGVLLTIQHTGFEEIQGQLVLSLEDINALTTALNELERWV